MKKVLYITYDGLTDPLGQSQILPYLKGLSASGYRFTILSFEKKERMEKEEALVRSLTQESGIEWVPLAFTSRPPLLSKFYDALRMKQTAVKLHKEKSFDMVHCRSYIAADVGLYLKKRYGVKFFFDMRGFWADEKKDGSWNVAHPVFKRVYRYYKNREAQYLQSADYIISLTHAGKREMMTWPSFRQQIPVQVIPCCADMGVFSLTSPEQKKQSREKLGITGDRLVLSYLGSVGTWYMLDEMLQFFATVKKSYPDARFLFVTHSDHQMIRDKASAMKIHQSDILIVQGARKEVPALIKASDINISFIRPVYSKISSSPTKLGEVLSMGIPVICNSGVGDVEEVVNKAHAGYVLRSFTEEAFEAAVASFPELLKKNPEAIRRAIEPVFSLSNGIEMYRQSYQRVFS